MLATLCMSSVAKEVFHYLISFDLSVPFQTIPLQIGGWEQCHPSSGAHNAWKSKQT